ncbi:ATP-dependent DNA helicase [Candidatus Woesearchaeota archaeon]|nr:ATP-dependent DNA helicase [Candidatus Woesearchaeota archaeon]
MQELSSFLFPHETVRPIQHNLMNTVQDCLRQKKHLIVHAPTGLGKTAATLPLALAYALEHKYTVFFLTSRHTQHAIAIETLKQIKQKYNTPFVVADMIGKKWMCAQPNTEHFPSSDFAEFCKHLVVEGKCPYYNNTRNKMNLTVKAKTIHEELKQGIHHTDHIIATCTSHELCPYEVAVSLAKNAQVIIADYLYLFAPYIRDSFFLKIQRNLPETILIIDEGHNLPSRVRDLASFRLTNLMVKRAIIEAKKFGYDDTIGLLSHLQDLLNTLSEGMKYNDERLVIQQQFVKAVERIHDYEQVIADLTFIAASIRERQQKTFIGGIAHFLEAWQGTDEGYARILSLTQGRDTPLITLSYRCLDPSVMTQNVIQQTYATILMSGTLSPPTMYRDLLGFPKDTVVKEYPSPFPKTNRMNVIIPHTTTKFSERNESQYKEIATICAHIANTVPGNSAFFFPSYFLRDKVAVHFHQQSIKTTLVEVSQVTKQQKQDLLERFKQYHKTGAVLLAVVSGSFAEGIDLPGDFLKTVVIVGLPLNQPDLEAKELIKYYDLKFGLGWDYGYVLPAMIKSFQSAGRCIRSETDRGMIFFLDVRYQWPQYFKTFPKDWEVAISKEYISLINHFFQNNLQQNQG